MRRRTVILAAGAALISLTLTAMESLAIDWAGVPEREIVLFYPGQASWEWALTEKDHSGAPKFREGKNCKACHEGEQAEIGARIVGGEKLEPLPPAGKPGSIPLKVQVAIDVERLYFRLRWKGAAAGGARMDPDVAERVTVMIDDGHVKEAVRAGCWGACHDDARGMASAAADSKMTKYLGASRVKLSRSGGGTNLKPAADLATQLQQGRFLEYWQAQLNPGKPAQASSGYVLEERRRHSAPANAAEAVYGNDEWTVVLSRLLKAGGPGQKEIRAGSNYTVAFAVHDDYAEHRYHHVSLEQSLVLGPGKADIVAARK